jgi:hypothetical protein
MEGRDERQGEDDGRIEDGRSDDDVGNGDGKLGDISRAGEQDGNRSLD